jgi:HTH-type transcriptional regulator/antitoxin HipB
MNYPVATAPQLRAVLKGMRKAHALSQAQVGQLLGVNQKRAAKIEATPGVTSFDQIARLVTALGGLLVIEMPDAPASPATAGTTPAKSPKARKAAKATKPPTAADTW